MAGNISRMCGSAQKQPLRCLSQLCVAHSLSMLVGALRLRLESIQKGHVAHVMVLSPLTDGARSFFEERCSAPVVTCIPGLFVF